MKAWWQMVRTVRRGHYDVVADLFGNPRTAQLAWVSGARLKIGPRVRLWDAVYQLRTQADRPGPRPAWEAYFDVLRSLGLKQLSLRPRWDVAPADERFVAEWLRARRLRPQAFIGVFAGGTHPAKRWPLARFLETAKKCKERLGLPSVFAFGPLEKALREEYAREGAKLRLTAEDFTPGQLAALWAASAVVLSNDAFPLHLGPAVGTPTVGLFGPGDPAAWFPYPEKSGHRFLHAAPDCWPCHKDACDDNICWRELTVDQVSAAVAWALAPRGRARKTIRT
jgi:ADP-heptose:LPS heptosyltransferase